MTVGSAVFLWWLPLRVRLDSPRNVLIFSKYSSPLTFWKAEQAF